MQLWKGLALGFAVSATLGLNACSSGGGGGRSPTAVAKCAPVAGVADDVQTQLNALTGQLAAVPEAGAVAAQAVRALVSMTDAVDALAAMVQDVAATQDPQALAAAADRVGAIADCGLDKTAKALAQLDAGPLAGTPAEAAIEQALAQIETVQGVLGSSAMPGAIGIGAITGPLTDLSAQLDQVVALIPADVSGLPESRLVLAALADSVEQLADILDEAAQLDAAGTVAAMTGYYTQLADAFGSLARSHAGPLSPVVLPVIVQVEGAADGAVPVITGGLALILETVFDALRTVLGGPVAAPPQFEAILAGLLAGVPVSGDLGGLVNSLAGGGGEVPELGSLLGGVPVLGELVAEILGSSGDPMDVLMDVLNGAPGMPTLVDVIGDLPGLGGTFPPSTGEVEQLVDDLLELADGVPVIAEVLDEVGGQFTQANLDEVTGLLNGLLGGIL